MAVNEMPHAVAAIQESVCCGCDLTTLNSQPAILKSLLIVASWAGCKLLGCKEAMTAGSAASELSAITVQGGFRAIAT